MRAARLGLVCLLVGCPSPSPRSVGGYAEPQPLGAPIHDPVTRAQCARGPRTESAVYEGRTFYFCAPENRATFLSDLRRYGYR